MEQVIKFLEKTEGRDKITKALQYLLRILKASVSSPDLAARLHGLFVASADARKIFRLLKSLNEI
jgi:hypothetical protein